MASREATARIKINKLLEAAGWRFFPEGSAPANIRLEPSVTIKPSDLEALGENFEKTRKSFIDFLLLDTAKKGPDARRRTHPLDGYPRPREAYSRYVAASARA